jgi:hypothetical protein
MEKQWRSSPQPSEQEPPAAQQAEAILGTGAAPGEIPQEEAVCRGRGRPYGRTRKLGERALETGKQEAPKVSKRRFETAEELVHDFSLRYPEAAAQIRKRLSPEWERRTWERIDKNWNLRTINDLPQAN